MCTLQQIRFIPNVFFLTPLALSVPNSVSVCAVPVVNVQRGKDICTYLCYFVSSCSAFLLKPSNYSGALFQPLKEGKGFFLATQLQSSRGTRCWAAQNSSLFLRRVALRGISVHFQMLPNGHRSYWLSWEKEQIRNVRLTTLKLETYKVIGLITKGIFKNKQVSQLQISYPFHKFQRKGIYAGCQEGHKILGEPSEPSLTTK